MSAVKTLGTIGLGGATLLGSVTNAHAQKKETKPNQGETVEEVRLSAEQVKSLKPDLKDLTKSLTAKTTGYDPLNHLKSSKPDQNSTKKISYSTTKPNKKSLSTEELEQRETIYQEYGHVIPPDLKVDFIRRADQQISNRELRNFLYGICLINNAEEKPNIGEPQKIILPQEVTSLMSHDDLDIAGGIVFNVAKSAKYGFQGRLIANSELRNDLLTYMKDYKIPLLPKQKERSFASTDGK